MNWDDLRIFLAVARTGTLARAGTRLDVDPTTVARRIQRLEVDLSAILFEHTPAGHVLTARGQTLLAHAQRIEDAAIAAGETGGGSAGLAEGVIRVSVSEGFGGGIIAPHLDKFAAIYPNIAIELVASTGFLNPSRREADIAIMLARPKRGPLLVRKLTDYALGLYGRADLPPVHDAADLATHRIIGYVPDLIYAPELRYLDEIPEAPRASLASTSVNAQLQMVRHGAGIGILPCFLAQPDSRLIRLLPDQIAIQRAFWLVLHRDMRGIQRIRLFIAWLDSLIERLQPLLRGS